MNLRVLQILPELNVGGVETGTVDLAKYLLEHGHTPLVVSNGGALVQTLEHMGVTHYQLPVHKKSLMSAWRCARALKRIIIEEKVDIVHARSRVPAWIAFLACRGTAAAFITTCHGYYSTHVFSRVMGWAKYVIVPSEVIGRHMIEDFDVPADHIRCIPRSVDLDRFNLPHQPQKMKTSFRIVIIGRLTPLKGHMYFLKAMAKVVRIMPYVKVWVVGAAPRGKDSYRQELEALTRRLGLTDTVEFLGNRKDVPQLLSQADVLVLSSTVPEAFGRVIIEAQAADVPVVATRVGGVVEIIEHEKTGLLVLPKDPDAMAQAVIRLLQDRPFAQTIVEQAKKKVLAQYTLAHMAKKTLAVYKELLKTVNILVIKISAVGDVVLATAALKAVREKFPQARIVCLVGEESRVILQRCPYIDELIVIDAKPRRQHPWRVLQLGRKLARNKFDKVIDFQNNRLSHILAFCSFARERYGYNRKWGFLLNRPVVLPETPLPPVPHQFRILSFLEIPAPPEGTTCLELWPAEKDHKRIQELFESEWLGAQHNVVGLHLAASVRWGTKNWPLEYAARLCDLLAAKNIRVVITGVDKDFAVGLELLRLTKSKPANFIGKTDIMEMAALISRCRVFITPDSAPMHVAAAMGTPFIALFGPTAAFRHLPPADRYVVFQKKLPCSPCYSPKCRLKTLACMKEISPEEVAEQVVRLMAE
ncbi:MAG TPA: lipopolysaccharide heptosyltransferase II [Candidatus Omnitrophota bacterium]|nr:lipopolysaccharide heptosyltransferase II [Candidatus Omnitrophota bacterium]HQO57348.1 lipopolysaccharide heptosyltransferase II [Candidatus Omnitrophota bacterium]